MSDITRGNLSYCTQVHLEPKKAFYSFFHIYLVVLNKTLTPLKCPSKTFKLIQHEH